MTTTKRIALALGALSVVAAGCGSADTAATVNGSEIPASEVLDFRTDNAGESTVSAERMRSDLSRLILLEALLGAAEDQFGLTGFESAQARQEFLSTAPPGLVASLEAIPHSEENPNFSSLAVDASTTFVMLRAEVGEALVGDEETLRAIWDAEQDSLVQACIRHIVVETEAEAQDVLSRLEAGEDFASVSDEISIDTVSPGGALQCPAPLSILVEPFPTDALAAPIGELSGPIQTVFGWHVYIVDDRQGPQTFDEFAANPTRWLTAETVDGLWAIWLNDTVDRADIEVRRDIGMWYPPVDGIIPPPPSP
jgi:parvulin-like peptidyl-prolyl isomerase